MSKTFESSRAPEPVGAFPHAKRVGNFFFFPESGRACAAVRRFPASRLIAAGKIVSYDIEKQCRAVFENVRLVLEDAGASWNDMIDVTVFLTNMKKDFPIYNKLYAEYFAGAGKPNPTRTTIEILSLPTPIAIELKVIAAVGNAGERRLPACRSRQLAETLSLSSLREMLPASCRQLQAAACAPQIRARRLPPEL